MEFEWLDFVLALDVFEDPEFRYVIDDRKDYGETRYVGCGISEGRMLSVCFTIRGNKTRIISLRKMRDKEKKGDIMATVSYNLEQMREKRAKTKTDWARVDALAEKNEDFSDNPEWTDEMWTKAVKRGRPRLSEDDIMIRTSMMWDKKSLDILRTKPRWQTRLREKTHEWIAMGMI